MFRSLSILGMLFLDSVNMGMKIVKVTDAFNLYL